MKEDKNIVRRQFYSKQSLFDFLCTFQIQRSQHNHIPILFYVINATLHLLFFLNTTPIAMLDLKPLLSSLEAFIGLVSMESVILLEIFFYLWRKVDLFLCFQLQTLIFVIVPLLQIYTFSLVQQNQISSVIGVCLTILHLVVAKLLLTGVFFERYRSYSLQCSGSYIVTSIFAFQTLLASLNYLNSMFLTVLTFLLVVSFSTWFNHFRNISINNEEFKCLHAINYLHICFAGIFLVNTVLGRFGNNKLELIAGVLVYLYLLTLVFSRKNKNYVKPYKVLLYQGGQASLLRITDELIHLLKNTNNKQKTQLLNFLLTTISEHNRQCKEPTCQLSSKSNMEDLKNRLNQNPTEIVERVITKIDEIFSQFHEDRVDDIAFTFQIIKFHLYALQNKSKLQNILSRIPREKLVLSEQFQVYKYSRLCQSMKSREVIDTSKVDEQIINFENTMTVTLNLIQEFWLQFYEDIVDLKKVRIFVDKIYPYKLKIDQIYEEKLKNEQFSSFKILKTYAYYQRTILNHQQFSYKIEDYLKILMKRLRGTQDINSQSEQTETGLVAISLTENKLGNIFLISKMACKLFKYSSASQIIGQNVRNIMPKVFADKHDQILTNFLKKKLKQYNTDQRLLFGKDSNGYIFPIQLQLRKATFSSSNQLIFIALVKAEKLRASPIYCMVDDQGEIGQHSAAFRNIFFTKYSQFNRKFIQQIVPNFFQVEGEKEMNQSRQLVMCFKNPKLGLVKAQFTITPVIVKGQKLCFLVSMVYNQQYSQPQYENDLTSGNVPLTVQIKKLQKEQQLKYYTNNYNTQTATFQMSRSNDLMTNISQHFTIPYISINDIAAFAVHKQKTLYSGDIKTIRLKGDHFQRVEDDENYSSDLSSNSQQVGIQAKLQKMKQESGRGNSKLTGYACFKIATIGFVLILVVIIMLYLNVLIRSDMEKEHLATFSIKNQVRFYLPQFVIYFSLSNLGINQTYFSSKMVTVTNQLVTSLSQAELTQLRKESILKIIQMKDTNYTSQVIADNLVTSHQQHSDSLMYIYIFSGLLLFLGVLVLFMMCGLMKIFKLTLLQVYNVFLSLKQRSIRRMDNSCRNLIKKINVKQQNIIELEEEKQVKNVDESENQIERLKHFKESDSFSDQSHSLQLYLPFLVLLILIVVVMGISLLNLNNYLFLKNQHEQFFEVLPAASAEFMKHVLRSTYNQTITLNNRYSFYIQRIQRNLKHFQARASSEDFMRILYGDICSTPKLVAAAQRNACLLIENGILRNGVAPALNFLSQQFPQLSTNTTVQTTHLLSLLQLYYTYVNPVLLKIEIEMQQILKNKIQTDINLTSQLLVVIIVLLILNYIFMVLVPLKSMEHEIEYTNDMLSLIPKQIEAQQQHHPQ